MTKCLKKSSADCPTSPKAVHALKDCAKANRTASQNTTCRDWQVCICTARWCYRRWSPRDAGADLAESSLPHKPSQSIIKWLGHVVLTVYPVPNGSQTFKCLENNQKASFSVQPGGLRDYELHFKLDKASPPPWWRPINLCHAPRPVVLTMGTTYCITLWFVPTFCSHCQKEGRPFLPPSDPWGVSSWASSTPSLQAQRARGRKTSPKGLTAPCFHPPPHCQSDSSTDIFPSDAGGCSQTWQHPSFDNLSGILLVEKKADASQNLHAGMSCMSVMTLGQL